MGSDTPVSGEGKTPALNQGLFFELEEAATRHLCPVFLTGRLVRSSSLSSGSPLPVLGPCLRHSAGKGFSAAVFLSGSEVVKEEKKLMGKAGEVV